MMGALRHMVVSKLSFSMRATNNVPYFCQSLSRDFKSESPMPLFMTGLYSFSSRIEGSQRLSATGGSATGGSAPDSGIDAQSADGGGWGRRNPPEVIPGRPLRGEKPKSGFPSQPLPGKGKDFSYTDAAPNANKPSGDFRSYKDGKPWGPRNLSLFDDDVADDSGKNGMKQNLRNSPSRSFDKLDDDFLSRFKFGVKKEGKSISDDLGKQGEGDQQASTTEVAAPQPEDADEIFKKMKETGLIPNAVAMLDSLCKDGLVQEALKLFGLMREKGSIPEVVVYTAVVEGFCKAHKFDDAKRIFRKMQTNDISPNAFSYAVIIRGLHNGGRLDEALDFCMEMLEAGHSPNLATFVGLIDAYCREKGVEEAKNIVGNLKQKGLVYDEKTAKEYLDRKGPFLPATWEVVLGKKISQRLF